MSDNPYAPPGSHIGQPVAASAQRACPWQVVVAVWLATVNYGIGFTAVLAAWDHGYSSDTEFIISIFGSLGVSLWIYYRIYQGRNWARMILLVQFLVGTAMVSSRFGNMMDHSAIEMAWAVAGVALKVVCLYFVFISPGRHWFRRQAAKDTPPAFLGTSKPESGI
ncbi:MAG: hypothetical protein JWM59_848 [Verrucomicrobiales bacterium]|nr:hypothetical protein [Verrucomicrobiales bacterium]